MRRKRNGKRRLSKGRSVKRRKWRKVIKLRRIRGRRKKCTGNKKTR
jgi:hypothetical protein